MRWKHTLHLKDIWHDELLSFEEKRDEVVRRIRAKEWYDEMGLGYIVDELALAGTIGEFDNAWDVFYDYADNNAIWVSTF